MAIEEKYTGTYGHTKESAIMMKPVIDCALDAFIRGLPDDISIFVDTRNPKDLNQAFEHALHAEERQTYYYPYPPHPTMMQCPPVEKCQKAARNSSWQGQSKIAGSITPPRSASPGPSGALNSQSTRRSDAVTSNSTILITFVIFIQKSHDDFHNVS